MLSAKANDVTPIKTDTIFRLVSGLSQMRKTLDGTYPYPGDVGIWRNFCEPMTPDGWNFVG